LASLRRDERGQTTALFGLFMGVLAIGFMAFALDVGSLFREKRMAQAAADAAAVAAAEEASAGATSNEQTVANAIAKMNGFDTTLAKNPATVTLTTVSSPTFGSAIQATVSKPIPTFFMGVFSSSMTTMTVTASAMAGGGTTSSTCVCLDGASGETLNLSNDAKITASGCGIVSNSTSSNAIGIVGGATLTATTLGTVSSSWDNSSNINNGGSIASSTDVIQGISSTCSAPTLSSTPSATGCVADPGGSYGTFTFGPSSASSSVCYNGLTIGANGSTVTLNPGIYVINNGELHFESGSGGHSNLGGNGVFFYLTGTASLVIDNGANVNLVAGGANESGGGTAPTVGSYNGFVIYQASSDTNGLSIQGGSSTFINGAMVAPGATITLGNGSGATIEGGISASSLVMNGGGTIDATADVNEGSLTVSSATPKLVQ
jgi:Flp pilus assembly protein TadG